MSSRALSSLYLVRQRGRRCQTRNKNKEIATTNLPCSKLGVYDARAWKNTTLQLYFQNMLESAGGLEAGEEVPAPFVLPTKLPECINHVLCDFWTIIDGLKALDDEEYNHSSFSFMYR